RAPDDVKRCTFTHLPVNARAAVTFVEKVALAATLTDVSVISGRTLTVTDLLVALFQCASYDVCTVGVTVSVHWPPLAVATELASGLRPAAGYACAMTWTLSPAL